MQGSVGSCWGSATRDESRWGRFRSGSPAAQRPVRSPGQRLPVVLLVRAVTTCKQFMSNQPGESELKASARCVKSIPGDRSQFARALRYHETGEKVHTR